MLKVQSSWEDHRERLKVKGINHQETYGLDGARTGLVEEHVHLRCAEPGLQHRIPGSCPCRYVQASWRKERRGVSNIDQMSLLLRSR